MCPMSIGYENWLIPILRLFEIISKENNSSLCLLIKIFNIGLTTHSAFISNCL